MKKLWEKLTSREVLLYMVFGVLTTVVEITVFILAIWILSDTLATIANVPSFLGGAAFSFFMNKKIVFRQHDWQPRQVMREGMTFLLSRVLSFCLEELGLHYSVAALHLDQIDIYRISGVMYAKVALSISVAVINYFVGKFIVFRPAKKSEKN